MALIANSTQAFVGSYPALYQIGSGLDQYSGDGTVGDVEISTIEGRSTGTIYKDASTAIFTGNTTCGNVSIDTEFGLIGIVESQTTANTANLHLVTTSGDELLNFRIPASTTSTFGGQGTFAMGNGRMVIGDRGHNSTNGRALVYDYEGNLLHTLTLQTASGLSSGWEYGVQVAIGCGRIVIGAPSWYTGGNQTGIYEIWDLDGNYINNLTPPYTPPSFREVYGKGEVKICDGRIIFMVARDDGTSFSHGDLLKITDLDGNVIYNHRIETSSQVANSRIAAGSGIVGVLGSNPGGNTLTFHDLRFGSQNRDNTNDEARGAILDIISYSGFFSGHMAGAIGMGRYVASTPSANINRRIFSSQTDFTQAGAVSIYDLNSRDSGLHPIVTFIAPESDMVTNLFLGMDVAIGYDYVAMSTRGVGSTGAKVYCEEIATAITPFDIANQQSYGY